MLFRLVVCACALVPVRARAEGAASEVAVIPRPSQAVINPNAGFVSAHAEAHRRLPNTVSDVSVGIEVHARDAPAAAGALAKRSQQLLGYLRDQHVERLRTDAVSFDPETTNGPNGTDATKIVGYAGRTAVSFRTEPDLLTALLAGALDHGGNTIDQSGSMPREEEVEAARRELAVEASNTAFAQVKAVTKAVGEVIGGIAQLDIAPTEMPLMRPMMARQAAGLAKAAQPIATEAGDMEVTVSVTIRVRILPG